MEFTPKLTYKGHPLVRSKNEIYYGSLSDPYVVYMQLMSPHDENGLQISGRVHVMLLSTDMTKPPQERVIKQSAKTGLYSAVDIGSVWLERALKEAKAAKQQ